MISILYYVKIILSPLVNGHAGDRRVCKKITNFSTPCAFKGDVCVGIWQPIDSLGQCGFTNGIISYV